jgi:hypothetical protein
MTPSTPRVQTTLHGQGARASIRRALTIFAAALLSMWPALLNRYPLLYADSLSYLDGGLPVLRALRPRPATFIGMRSEFYSLGIFAFHWGISPWPVVVLQALLTAYIVWLVTRAFVAKHTVAKYLILMALLSGFTSMSWYVSLVMPDILGPILYLCICLLVFAPETLSKREHWAVAFIAWFGIVSHSTHFVLTLWIIAILAALLLFKSRLVQHRGRALGEIALLVAVAAAAQVALHTYLYHEPSLNGRRLPYLSARFVADGPEKWYLQQHCATEQWVLCANLKNLPDNDDEFIWGENTIWTKSSPADQQLILKQETPLLLATLRTYPRQQLAISLGSFVQQLNDFGVNDFDNNTWMEESIEETMPGAHACYERSLQARSIVPTNFFTQLQRWTVCAAILVLIASLPWLWRTHQTRFQGFLIVIIPTLIANAFITAVASEVDSRFQARVVWLLPLLAGLIVFCWEDSRRDTPPTAS